MNFIKKLVSILLSFIIIVSLFSVNIYTYAASITTAYVNHTSVNVRSGAGTSFASLGQISNCTVEYISSEKNSAGETWYKIKANVDGEMKTGYVRSDFVTISTYNPEAGFEEKLTAFPKSYWDSLRKLHAMYPNWEFIPDVVSMSFDEAVELQSINMRKQVSSSHTTAWRSMAQGYYDWDKNKYTESNGGWFGASKEVISYYMDPRNFLNASDIYQFMQQNYNSQTTETNLANVVKGTFLEKPYPTSAGDIYGGSYSKLLLDIGKAVNVDPCVLASAIIQEQGTKGSNSIISGKYPGYEGYYNFFNVNASGANTTEVIKNGLEYAKSKVWNSVPASIKGGAEFFKSNYIVRYKNDKQNQDTYYYQDFNLHTPSELWHQFAQAIHDACSKGSILNKAYKANTNYSFKFRIPIFTDMPNTPMSKPKQGTARNNYYFKNIDINGLTPSFNKYIYNYSLSVSGDSAITVETVEGAIYTGKSSYTLKKGDNVIPLTVKSETGYTTTYNISVYSTVDCKIYITLISESTNTVKFGDANNDSVIDIVDLALVQMDILNIKKLPENMRSSGDVNKDDKIDIVDLALIQMDILNIKKIQ